MKTSHQTFILEMVKHGDKELAWQKANPGNKGGNSARKAADRLLRRHPEMAAEIEEAVATIRHQAYAEAYRLYTEQQKTPLLSMMNRREILARIARCEVKVCRYVKDGDRFRMLFEDPRPRDMMLAMQIDAKFEEACNRMRNINDPILSQFNIYIDGRPCDDPAAPINTDLPPGIVMLPRKAKKMLQEATAAESEELSPAGGGVTPVTGVGRSRGTENTENGNPPATLDTHNTSPHPGVPIAIGIGVKLAQENSTKNGNPPATLSPTSYPNPFGSEELSPAPDKFGSGGDPARLSRAIRDAGTGVGHSRGTQNTSPHPGDLGVYSRGTENTGLDPVSPHSPLYQTYQYILEKRKLAEEDILHASWYSQQKRAEAEAPPPHILTDEEIAEMNRTLAEERSRTLAQPQYSTFGKIYFPEKDTRCSL